jgi:hypothetical protein
MRVAAVVAVFVVLCLSLLVVVVAPASGQTIPPIPTYPAMETPVTPYPTATPRPGCAGWCAPMPPTPEAPPPDAPPLVPIGQVEAAFPGQPMYYDYLYFLPAVGHNPHGT